MSNALYDLVMLNDRGEVIEPAWVHSELLLKYAKSLSVGGLDVKNQGRDHIPSGFLLVSLVSFPATVNSNGECNSQESTTNGTHLLEETKCELDEEARRPMFRSKEKTYNVVDGQCDRSRLDNGWSVNDNGRCFRHATRRRRCRVSGDGGGWQVDALRHGDWCIG